MKISICFSGHLRTFKDCIPFYKKFQKDHEVRFFMHTWQDVSPLESSWHKFDKKPKKINENDFSFLKKKLSSLELLCEDQSEIIKKLNLENLGIREKVYYLINYSQNTCINMALDQNWAEVIISSRPDIKFLNEKILFFLSKFDLEKFYVLGNSNNNSFLEFFSACDAINISNPRFFKIKLNYFKENLNTFSSSTRKNGYFYQKFQEDTNIPVEIAPIKFQKDWKIKRSRFSLIRNLFNL